MRSRDVVHRLVHAIELPRDRLRRRLAGPPRRLTVASYLGHGSHESAVVRGRVLGNRPVVAAIGPEPVRVRLRRMVARLSTREIPGVPLVVHVGDTTTELLTDEEGYFVAQLDGISLPVGPRLRDVEITVDGPLADLPLDLGEPRIMVPEPDVGRIVVSDIDDTVLQTGATNRARMVLTTMTGSAWTRTPFAGVAELYAGLVSSPAGVDAPCCYVSSSPWNLYDFLVAFLDRTGLPHGPLHLRDLGVDEHQFIAGAHAEHKSEAIEEILRIHTAPIVLSGDTGERDPEIFREVIRHHGERVEGVLLRHVAGPTRLAEVEAEFRDVAAAVCIAEDSAGLAAAAERCGLVPAGWAERVRRAR